MYRRIQQQAGFIHFAQKEFDQAKTLFMESEIDVREVRERQTDRQTDN
jgi:hypothetical protein